jgi:hypothetical protein
VPSTGLGAGDVVYLEFVTDAADNFQIQIPYGTAVSGRSIEAARPIGNGKRTAAIRSREKNHSLSRKARGVPTATSGS